MNRELKMKYEVIYDFNTDDFGVNLGLLERFSTWEKAQDRIKELIADSNAYNIELYQPQNER